jgi:hypothetical protein
VVADALSRTEFLKVAVPLIIYLDRMGVFLCYAGIA